MFPLQHLHSVIDGAANGQHFMVSKLYDGSVTGEQLFEATTVVGRKLADPLDLRATSFPCRSRWHPWMHGRFPLPTLT